MSEAAFVDTAALLALLVRSDSLHAAARAVETTLASERAPLVTSDWVLTEFLNAASRPPLREAAARVVRRLESSPRTEIVPADRAGWSAARALYESRPDKDGPWSTARRF